MCASSLFLLWELNGSVSSTIIEEIDAMRKSELALLAFFYCDFREQQKKVLRGLLSSLLVQLCHQSDSYCDILSKFCLEHEHGSRDPKDKDLARCLKALVEIPERAPVYLILDALDECPNTFAMPSPREDVLKLVKQLSDSRHANLRICVTSRPETDIKAVLVPLALRCAVSLHDEIGQLEDIENYIKSVVNMDSRNRRWTTEDKQRVIDILTERVDGM
jgi:DNA-directed RNA polymerase beta' subunit